MQQQLWSTSLKLCVGVLPSLLRARHRLCPLFFCVWSAATITAALDGIQPTANDVKMRPCTRLSSPWSRVRAASAVARPFRCLPFVRFCTAPPSSRQSLSPLPSVPPLFFPGLTCSTVATNLSAGPWRTNLNDVPPLLSLSLVPRRGRTHTRSHLWCQLSQFPVFSEADAVKKDILARDKPSCSGAPHCS